MNHNIIRDEAKLKEFINWLPELNNDEVFFVCLQARHKYMDSIKCADKTQLKRFVSTKVRLLDKIRQLECPIGSYLTNDGKPITDEALALYITINPRNMRKATFASIRALTNILENPVRELNPHAVVLSEIHKAKSRSCYVHFDVDLPTGTIKDENANKGTMSAQEAFKKCSEIVGKEAVSVVVTRGGYHVMVAPNKVVSETKNWYPIISKMLNSDQQGELMLPVPATNQGGFMPYFI